MKGYLRNDGRKGIRNLVAVTYLVECAHHVAQRIVDSFPDDDIHLIGFGGCAPNAYAEKVMQQLCTHPNVGGVVIVSLGCENFQREKLLQRVTESGRMGELIVIQENGGTRSSIEKGVVAVRGMLSLLNQVPVVDFLWSDLMVGTVCGGSDATSGVTANPAVGKTFDKLIAKGATCIFEEPGELIGCEHLMRQRGATTEIGEQLFQCVRKADAYYKKMGHDSFSEGNAVGGLSTIEDKSLGSYSKSGSHPINGLLYPGDQPPQSGLYFMDVVPDGEALWGFPNVNDNAEIVEMSACGCHLILYTSGRGSVAGSAISPVIKVCGNPHTCQALSEDIDINASRIISEGASLEDISDETIAYIHHIINGNQTKSEALGHREFHLGYKYFDACQG